MALYLVDVKGSPAVWDTEREELTFQTCYINDLRCPGLGTCTNDKCAVEMGEWLFDLDVIIGLEACKERGLVSEYKR